MTGTKIGEWIVIIFFVVISILGLASSRYGVSYEDSIGCTASWSFCFAICTFMGILDSERGNKILRVISLSFLILCIILWFQFTDYKSWSESVSYLSLIICGVGCPILIVVGYIFYFLIPNMRGEGPPPIG